jgi:hypothetical protein
MPTESRTFTHACILTASVQTNVPQGGDAGHGGVTRVVLTDEGSFAFADNAEEIVVEVLGDAEAEVLADALTWAGERLRAMIQTGRLPA